MKCLYVLAVCIFSILRVQAVYGQSVSKEKKVSGHFAASKGKLVIDNMYGNLDIKTWDKNEVTVDITITAKARSENKAQNLLDRVSITQPSDNSTGIRYKTEIGKSTINEGEFRTDYVVNMPRQQTAELINKYGDIDLKDVSGKLTVDLDYGSLRTGVITGNDNDIIRVSYGSGTIASIESGTIKSSYSKLSIDKAGSIEVSNQFEKTTIGSVRDLDINQKYGDLKIGSVSQLKGSVQYAGLTVDKLLKSVQMTLKYGTGTTFENIGPGVDNVDINAMYSNLSLHFDSEANLSGDVDVSYGNVSRTAPNFLLTMLRGGTPGQSPAYKCKVGNGRGNLAIKASYGNVVIK